jgi:MoxR-like ATPase
MIHTLADALNLTFNRIQFTPDLMPSDITGTEVIQEDKATGVRQFKFLRGPVFANIVLADEINRTPPKTQAALLEAMQERQVTIGGERHRLPDPFFVLATQNPIEQEGTYPLPEAQLDRFMLNILVDYPGEEEELDIVRLTTSTLRPVVSKVLSGADILELQEIVRKVPVAEHVMRYAVRLTRMTRRDQKDVPDFIRDYVSWGRRPARQPVPGARRQGPGRPVRPLLRLDRRHPRGRRPRAPTPDHHQLQRRSRGAQARRYRQAAGQGDPDRRARGRTEWKTTKNI